jgi:hypothetical protein
MVEFPDSNSSKQTRGHSCFPIRFDAPNGVPDQEIPKFVGEPEQSSEKKRIANRLKGLIPKQSPAWQEITRRFGLNVKHPELVEIATVLSENANIRLDRDAKRRKAVLIKWFEENWADVSPYLDYVVLEETHSTE